MLWVFDKLFLMSIQMSDFVISSYCFTLLSSDFGVPKDHEDNRAVYEIKLSRLTVNIAFWEGEAMILFVFSSPFVPKCFFFSSFKFFQVSSLLWCTSTCSYSRRAVAWRIKLKYYHTIPSGIITITIQLQYEVELIITIQYIKIKVLSYNACRNNYNYNIIAILSRVNYIEISWRLNTDQ